MVVNFVRLEEETERHRQVVGSHGVKGKFMQTLRKLKWLINKPAKWYPRK